MSSTTKNTRIDNKCQRIKYLYRNRQKIKFNKNQDYFNKPTKIGSNNQDVIPVKRNWVVNLSKRKFTDSEISVLNLDPKFQLIQKHEQIIANIESKLSNLITDPVQIENVRFDLVRIFKN